MGPAPRPARPLPTRRRALAAGAGLSLPLLAAEGAPALGGPPATAANAAAPAPWAIDCRQFGAAGDGVRDDTAAMQAALDAAAARGGRVLVAPGVYLTRTLTIRSRVHLTGAGVEATVLKLRPGTDDDLLRTADWHRLTGTGSTSGPFNWSVSDLTLDGNRAGNRKGCGLRAYGWGYLLRDLRVRQCAGAGIDSEWSTQDPPWSEGGRDTPGDSMEAQVLNLKVHDCGEGGINFRGPHDSQFVNCVVWDTATNGIQLGQGAKFSATGCQLVNCHVWGGHDAGYKVEAGYVTLVNCVGEWARRCQLHVNVSDTTVSAGRFFGNPKSKHVGVEIGTAGAEPVYGTQIDARMADLCGGAFRFTNEGGAGQIRALVYQRNGPAFLGRPARGTRFELQADGIDGGSETWIPRGALGWNGGAPILRHLSGSTAWGPRSLAPGEADWVEVPVATAAPGDTVVVGFSRPLPPGALLSGVVTSDGVVAVTLFNATGKPLAVGPGRARADCWVH